MLYFEKIVKNGPKLGEKGRIKLLNLHSKYSIELLRTKKQIRLTDPSLLLKDASINMAVTPMLTAVSTMRDVVLPYTIGNLKKVITRTGLGVKKWLIRPYFTFVVFPVTLYLAVLLPGKLEISAFLTFKII